MQGIKREWIRSAALDVFEREPEMEPELLKLDNVVLAPHIASTSFETHTKMFIVAAENLVKASKGEVLPSLVNPEVLQK